MRKKSGWGSAVLGALLVVLLSLPLGGGCSPDEASVKVYTPDEQGVAECVADHPDQVSACSQSLQGAQKEQETTAEHFTSDVCADRFGPNACIDRGGYYAPAMAGFMFGAYVGSSMAYHPVYVDRWGSAYSGTVVLGTFRTGTTHIYVTPAPNSVWVKQYNYTTVSIPRSTPSAAPAFAAPAAPGQAPKIVRGGTGASAAISTAAPPTTKPPAMAPGATTASLPPPSNAIQRGNTGASAAGSTAAPPAAKKDNPQQPQPPPGGIQRGNTGGSAAITAASPPARVILDHSDPPENHMAINRGNTGASGSPRSATPPSQSSSPSSSSSRSSTSSGKGR